MWSEECISDLYQYGVKDSTLNLLYDSCKNSQVAVRTPVGLTERKNIENTVMQGDVFGPIFCATSIDSIGKECLQDEKYLYKYKEKVKIPPLSMIDDLACVSTCGVESVKLNAYINYKISSKRLQCGADKCKKMHIGKTCDVNTCTDLYVDGWKEENVTNVEANFVKIEDTYEGEEILKLTEGEKYLGDILTNDGRNYKNIMSRKNKGTAQVNEIHAIIAEIMLGKDHFEVSILLRNTMLISSLLFNSEAWYNLSKKEISLLESVDEHYLRKTLNSPSKTPKSLLYLETGCMPIKFILQSRRLNFLKYILDQEEGSLLKDIFIEQKNEPKQGDWVSIVTKDLKKLDINRVSMK